MDVLSLPKAIQGALVSAILGFDATCRSFLLYIVSLQMQVVSTQVPSVCLELMFAVAKKML